MYRIYHVPLRVRVIHIVCGMLRRRGPLDGGVSIVVFKYEDKLEDDSFFKRYVTFMEGKHIKIKPRLVDHSLISSLQTSKVVVKPIVVNKVRPTKIDIKSEYSFLYNVIGLLLLGIGVLYMYQRYNDRDETEMEKNQTILGFNQYVTESLRLQKMGSDKDNKSKDTI